MSPLLYHLSYTAVHQTELADLYHSRRTLDKSFSGNGLIPKGFLRPLLPEKNFRIAHYISFLGHDDGNNP
jgi:hypothetical protein